ncbi:MAG: hypothetical protein WCP28_13340, partial [Actinomycetes bacterium]
SFDYGPCVPQVGTPKRLDALGFRTMYRLAYRNYGTHESLAANMSVAATDDPDGQIAIRWYEIRSPGAASPVVYQQGTYAPDTTYRWVGSVAMDRNQNMALGYSRSSAVMSPDIAYTGRLATDPLGTLQAESVVPLPSTGSQDATRWGDYTAMQVDPVDDCTFWYTNQYLASDGIVNWRTRIVSFKFPSCLVPQTITFTPPTTTPLTAKTVALSAAASSGLPVSFTSLTTDVCSVSAAKATLLRAGTCTIRASQDGNQTYSAAASVVQSFAVTEQPQSQRPGSIPRVLRNPGITVVNPARARTVQGQPLTATVAAQLVRGDLVCLRVINGTHRKVSVAVTGRCVVKVRVTYTAPESAALYPYRNVLGYRLKKTRR